MHLKKNKNTVYFIGAGFTKAIANTAPTGTEFFVKAFASCAPFVSDEKINSVKNFVEDIYYPVCERENYPQIEDVLSLIDYTIQRKEALSRKYLFDDVITVRNNLIFLIGKVIKDSIEGSPEKNLELSRDFIGLLKSVYSASKVSIISSNYDIIIDNALLEVAGSCNYGIRLRKNLTQRGQRDTDIRPSGNTSCGFFDTSSSERKEVELNKGDFQLLKIHGSLNWFYCPKCDELDITIGRKGAVELAEDQNKYLCVNELCTANYEPLLVTPTMLKIYSNAFLEQLWTLSEKIVSQATELIFIGYSLPTADYHIRSLITKALAKNKRKPKVVIIEKNPVNEKEKKWSEKVKERYMTLLGKNVDFQPIGLEGFLENRLASQTHHPLS